MMKLPAGTTTISGHVSHSLKLSFGRNALSSAGDNGAARDWACPVTAPDVPANTINAMINATRSIVEPSMREATRRTNDLQRESGRFTPPLPQKSHG
jgi:hypothetical protein